MDFDWTRWWTLYIELGSLRHVDEWYSHELSGDWYGIWIVDIQGTNGLQSRYKYCHRGKQRLCYCLFGLSLLLWQRPLFLRSKLKLNLKTDFVLAGWLSHFGGSFKCSILSNGFSNGWILLWSTYRRIHCAPVMKLMSQLYRQLGCS